MIPIIHMEINEHCNEQRDQNSIFRILGYAEVRNISNSVEKALYIIKHFGCSYQDAANALNLSKYSIIRGMKATKESRDIGINGRPPLLTVSEKKEVISTVSEAAKQSQSMSPSNVSRVIQENAPNKLIRRNYVYEFIEQTPLSKRDPQEVENSRILNATTGTIEYWFNEIWTTQLAEEVDPRLIFNLDETSVELGKPRRVVVPEYSHLGAIPQWNSENYHISSLHCFSSRGKSMKPLLILPNQFLPSDIASFVAEGDLDAVGTEKGWINEKAFTDWIPLFIDFVNNIRMKALLGKSKAVLFLDGHSSRGTPSGLQLLIDNNIMCITFPSHLTHILQPFDLLIARPLKEKLFMISEAIFNNIGISPSPLKLADFRRVVAETLISASLATFTPFNCRRAFEIAGLVPRNPNSPMERRGVRNDPTNFCKTKEAGSRIRFSGRVITDKTFIDELVKQRN